MPDPYIAETWRNWIKENLQRGVKRTTVFEVLRNNGFGLGAIRSGMGDYYPEQVDLDDQGRDSSGRSCYHDQISKCLITRRTDDNLKRIPVSGLQMYVWEEFLEEDICDKIVDLTNKRLSKSTITTPTDAAGYDSTFRTSETCFLDQLKDPVAQAVNQKIGIALGVSPKWSEPIQAQKYSVGQEFKAHTDYFEPGSDEYKKFCSQMGQRTWTFMVYLNEGCKGGTTRFRKVNRQFEPKKGRAVIWNSMLPSGDPNPLSLHHGMKVHEGEKFVITKWFRDKGEGQLLREPKSSVIKTQ